MVENFLGRTRSRLAGPDDTESGSLILDILIGMAIFALIAIIAVSAIGQYRMRAYVQSAVSDATAVATAVQAAITDNAGTSGTAYPTGLLDAAALTALDVSTTGEGTRASAVTVIPSAGNPETFDVCVEHRGAYAIYVSDAGLADSGVAADEGFGGCALHIPADGDPDDPTPVEPPAEAACLPGPVVNVSMVVDLTKSCFINFNTADQEGIAHPDGYWTATNPVGAQLGLDARLDITKSYRVDLDWTPGPAVPGAQSANGVWFRSLITTRDQDNSSFRPLAGLTVLPWTSTGNPQHPAVVVASPAQVRRVDTLHITQGVMSWPVTNGQTGILMSIMNGARVYGVTITEVP